MKLKKPQTLKELSALIDCHYVGKDEHLISGLNEIHMVEPGDLVFVDHPKYYHKALESLATTILIDKTVPVPEGKAIIVSDDPFAAYNQLVELFAEKQQWETLVQSENKHISNEIAPNVAIGKNVVLGYNVTLMPGVVVGDNTIIGNNVTIHSNTVLGADAFYYQKRDGAYRKMKSCGRVIIEDDVEIGALCTIDRGVSGDTRIKRGTKIDNQVHIGHDTEIGANCLIAAQVGIAGCVTLENNVTLWGQVGLAANITIGENAVLLAQAGLAKSVPGNQAYFGSPAGEARLKMKETAAIKRLPQIIEELNNL